MFTRYKTKGFIFGKRDFREADRIFSIFTKDYGVLEILAKGERKITSKLRGALELFYLSEIEFIQGKTYKTLTDAALLEPFRNIRIDLEKLETAFRISEILRNLLKFQEPDEKIWNLILTTFKKLTMRQHPVLATTPSVGDVYHYFLWNFLSNLGYQPELKNCILCQMPIRDEQLIHFSLKEGGVICQNCFEKMDLKEKIYISKIGSDKGLEILSEDFLSFLSN